MNSETTNTRSSSVDATPEGRPTRSRWIWRGKWFWGLLLVVALVIFGSRKYEQLILQPPDGDWHAVALDNLLTDRWYETAEGRQLSEDLSRITDSRPMKFITGLYYLEYKKRYSPGYKNTQLVKIGPDQYPALWDMVVEACRTLGAIGDDGLPLPSVYMGWTGNRDMEITNFVSPSLVINANFLWAFSPDEMRYLIARQIGHLHCKHIYFLDVNKGARALLNSALPDIFGRIILGGIGANLLAWTKEAHISADRAGLLVTGDIDVACRALIKLNILSNPEVYYGQPDPAVFAAQTRLLTHNHVATASAVLAELKNPHPFLTTRVGDLLRFYKANSSLFKDQNAIDSVESKFDPGVYEDDESDNSEGK